MALDERSRHALFNRLEETLGQEHASVLMEHLPPVGWADVVTKHDLEQLEARLESRFERLESQFESRFEQIDSRFETTEHRLLATFRAEMIGQTRVMVFSMATAFVGVAGVTLAAARLV